MTFVLLTKTEYELNERKKIIKENIPMNKYSYTQVLIEHIFRIAEVTMDSVHSAIVNISSQQHQST